MRLSSFEAIVKALNDAGARYIVVGGLAVNAHGYQRLTHDVDFVIQLQPENIRAAFSALEPLGYRPTVPVTGEQFADADQRQSWIKDKGMRVLNLYSDQHRDTPLDLFVSEPFDFEREYEQAMRAEITPGLEARFANIPALIKMKEEAGRERDHDDIQHLRWIQQERSDD